MAYPNFSEEKKLWRKGYQRIAGLDEVGRGPLAGPVVAACVVILDYKKIKDIKGINDSKKISEKKREELYDLLTCHPKIQWGIGMVSEKVIDRINILEATKLAMQKALKNLNADFLLLDGNFKITMVIPQKSVIKGDQKILSVAMASIIAKVTRDRFMHKMHKKYPQYGFDAHKGYGTRRHYANIKKCGLSDIHRKTFTTLFV